MAAERHVIYAAREAGWSKRLLLVVEMQRAAGRTPGTETAGFVGGCRVNAAWIAEARGASRPGGRRDRPAGAAGIAAQGVAAAIRWLWSFRRLCVAVIRRHSLRQAALPRRWKRLIARLNLIWPKTGSTVICRWR